jgi:hypothetical protein
MERRMSDIRTPDDEVTTPGHFYPPFKEGWWYQGATYGGHSDFSTDWNRRTRTGGWLDDLGDPVLAAADGTVAEIDRSTGTVYVAHWGATYRTEYRHMRTVSVKQGQRVQRGDKLGEIGAEGIDPADGFVPSPHLHHVHWKKDGGGTWQRIQQSFEGKPVIASVGNSESQPRSWNAPGPVMVEGPPPKATWESAYKAAAEELASAEKVIARRTSMLEAQRAQTELYKDERDEARRELAASVSKLAELQKWSQDLAERHHAQTAELTEAKSDLATAGQLVDTLNADLAECRASTPTDCTDALKAARDAAAGELEAMAQRWRDEG